LVGVPIGIHPPALAAMATAATVNEPVRGHL
jgi:hypothetical protein